MNFINYSIILLLIFSSSIICINNKQFERIMNGDIAELGQFPYMVSLQIRNTNQHFCGGALLTNQHVLTAAHCFFTSSEERAPLSASVLQVRAGLIKLSKPKSVREIRFVRQVIIHEEFEDRSLDNDIAILVLVSPGFYQSSYLQTAKLSTTFINYKTLVDPFCSVIGWGRQCGSVLKSIHLQDIEANEVLVSNSSLEELENKALDLIEIITINKNNESSLNELQYNINQYTENDTRCVEYNDYYLRYAKVKLQNYTECAKDYQYDITDQVLCAGTRGSKVDSCKGDSGGPLICDGKLEGIVSFGDGCDNFQHLGVYTRVFRHLAWIEDKIKNSSNKITKFSIIFYILFIFFSRFHNVFK